MRQGYKQVIENNSLKTYKDDILVATESYDSETELLKMDTELPQISNFAHSTISADYKTIHSRLGHPGHQLLLKTINATDGIQITGKMEEQDCEICTLTKTRKTNIRKIGTIPADYLEVIESDTQGPFPIIGSDGTRNNIKFVDKKSRYVKMETIANREATTILKAFKRFMLFVSDETNVPLKSFTRGIYNGLDHCCSSTVEQDIGC